MKNFIPFVFIAFLVQLQGFAQQEKGIVGEDNWLNYWSEFNPNQREYREASKILTGDISENTTLYKRDVYLLLGSVFVTNGATLTIEPGTVILGDFNSKGSLTITRGSKIIAKGAQTDPIVFTSNRRVKRSGDWGGLILLGNARLNKFGVGSVGSLFNDISYTTNGLSNYGGESDDDNSGVLEFVRIEYAGKKLDNDDIFSALLLAGVGSETVIENIMTSFAGGNSFEVLGGNTSMSKLVSFKASGSDFRFNYGAQSNLYNSLAVRSPYASNSLGSRCLQVLSYNKVGEVDFQKSGTSVTAQNLTLLTDSDNLEAAIKMNLVQEAIYIGENAALDITKSVISGFSPAVILAEGIKINQQNLEKITLSDMLFDNCNGNIFTEFSSNNEDLENWYGNSSFFNVYSKSDNFETFINTYSKKKPDYRLQINKIIATNEVGSKKELRVD